MSAPSVDEFVIAAGQAGTLRKEVSNIKDKFQVSLVIPNEKYDDSDAVWIKLRGPITNVSKAKAYVKAVCNPDCEDNLWLHNLPTCVLVGLQKFWLNWIEYSCSVVVKQQKNETLIISGTQVDVTRAISLLQHLEKLSTSNLSGQDDFKFDQLVQRCADPFLSELLQLSSSLKKELLSMVDEAGKLFNPDKIRQENLKSSSIAEALKKSSIVFEKANSHLKTRPSQEALAQTPRGIVGNTESQKQSSKGTSIIQELWHKNPVDSNQAKFFRTNMKQMGFKEEHINKVLVKHGPNLSYHEGVAVLNKLKNAEEEMDTSNEANYSPIKDISTIVISDDDDGNDSVIFMGEIPASDANEASHDDAARLPLRLPPTVDIEKWLKENYVGTNDENDCVYKPEMLDHFRKDFKQREHPDLANEFFSKLSQSIFERDPAFSHVKSKGASGKSSKRRLVCIKKKTESVSDFPPARRGILKEWISSVSSPEDDPRSSATDKLPSPTRKSRPEASVSSQPGFCHPMQYPRPPIVPVAPQPVAAPPPRPTFTARGPHYSAPRPGTSTNQRYMSTTEILRLPQGQGAPNLRPVVIDGSNVACEHGNGRSYSCRGIALCVRYFWDRGHRDIICFVPNFRKGRKGTPPTTDQSAREPSLALGTMLPRYPLTPRSKKVKSLRDKVLFELEKLGIAKFTPSREVNGRPQVCYDDRFIVQLATSNGGVIVSNDQYRDLRLENRDWARTIDNHLLMYAYVGDLFMPPLDPLGRNGPNLDQFLSFNSRPPALPQSQGQYHPRPSLQLASPRTLIHHGNGPWRNLLEPHTRTARDSTQLPSERQHVVNDLLQIFPDSREAIERVVRQFPKEWRLHVLADSVLR